MPKIPERKERSEIIKPDPDLSTKLARALVEKAEHETGSSMWRNGRIRFKFSACTEDIIIYAECSDIALSIRVFQSSKKINMDNVDIGDEYKTFGLELPKEKIEFREYFYTRGLNGKPSIKCCEEIDENEKLSIYQRAQEIVLEQLNKRKKERHVSDEFTYDDRNSRLCRSFVSKEKMAKFNEAYRDALKSQRRKILTKVFKEPEDHKV